MKGYSVKSIDSYECKEWLLKKHYLKRIPSISYSFGLFKNNLLVGVCTFGNAVPMQMKKFSSSFFKVLYRYLLRSITHLFTL